MSIPADGNVVLDPNGQPLVLLGTHDRKALCHWVISGKLVLVTTFVLLRFLSRSCGKIRYWWDDWLIIPAYLGFLCSATLAYYFVAEGIGAVYIGLVTLAKVDHVYKMFIIFQVQYIINLCTTKLSILALYWRIFAATGSLRVKWAIRILGVFIVSWTIAAVCFNLMRCRIASSWDSRLLAACHWQPFETYLVFALVNAMTDLMMLALPIGIFMRTILSWKTKLALSALFAFGIVTTIFSLFASLALKGLDFEDPAIFFNFGWYYTHFLLLILCENAFLLVVACLSTLKPLVVRVRTRLVVFRLFFRSPLNQEHTEGNMPGNANRLRQAIHASPWSARLWGIESTHGEQGSFTLPEPEVQSQPNSLCNAEENVAIEV